MKAVRLRQFGKALEDVEIAVPEIGASEVLVRVAACGICHSDAHYRAGISSIDSLPVTLGHEVAGRVGSLGGDGNPGCSRNRVRMDPTGHTWRAARSPTCTRRPTDTRAP